MIVAAIVFAASASSVAEAQDAPALPDPATITVPDLSHSSDPEVVSNGWKYFFFQREGVSFAEAHADFTDCFRFLSPNDWSSIKLDRFAPWNGTPGRKSEYIPSPYGLVGALISGMIEGTLIRRELQAKMRRCMEPRGYTRYGVAEEVWERVTALPREQSIAVLARIASGPSFGGKVPVK